MLVLSRRLLERVLFPTLGVAVQVLQIKGNTVRLGVDAPEDVEVLRQELAGKRPPAPAESRPAVREAVHRLCNRLSKVRLGLHLFERQWEAGMAAEARATLAGLLDGIDGMDREWVLAQFAGGAAPVTPPANDYRALVVDDDPNERELLAGLLKMNGCECATAADGEAAFDYLASHDRPDVLLLDMWMPRCDGPHTVRRLRDDPRYAKMKVFAISSTSPQEAGIATGPQGVDAWFPKPLNPRKLWEAIRADVSNVRN